jgi:hypothetical protein
VDRALRRAMPSISGFAGIIWERAIHLLPFLTLRDALI